MGNKVLWQVIIASLLGASAGLTTALVLGYSELLGFVVGASVGFIACAPWEVVVMTKKVVGKKYYATVSELGLYRIIRCLGSRVRAVSFQRTFGSARRILATVRARVAKSIVYATIFLSKALTWSLVAVWRTFKFLLRAFVICLWYGICILSLPVAVTPALWFLLPWSSSMISIFLGIVIAIVVSFVMLCSFACDERRPGRYRKLSPVFPILWLWSKNEGGEIHISGEEFGPAWNIKMRAQDGTILKWRRVGYLFTNLLVGPMTEISCLLFPTTLAIDIVLTILMLLATTKRLASVSGAVLGYLSGMAWHTAGGGLIGSYAWGAAIAVIVGLCYLLRQPLSEGRLPFHAAQSA